MKIKKNELLLSSSFFVASVHPHPESSLLDRGNRANTRLVIFGSVKAQNDQPVLVVLDRHPVENNLAIEDMQKITSAYTKSTSPTEFVRQSEIVYADKKRTARLLRTIDFHMPIELQQSDYIGSISYLGQNVNINGEPSSGVFVESNTEKVSATGQTTTLNNEERFSTEEDISDKVWERKCSRIAKCMKS